jgi:hypothetical protein
MTDDGGERRKLHHTTIATTIRRGMIALARQSAVADAVVLGSR